jgi:hypothetical protein
MKWNVEKKAAAFIDVSLEEELEAMKNTIDVLLEQFRVLKFNKGV